MLEFVDSNLYFVQDENNFINPLLQIGSGFGSVEKVPDPAGQKSTDPTRSGSSISSLHPYHSCMDIISYPCSQEGMEDDERSNEDDDDVDEEENEEDDDVASRLGLILKCLNP